MKPDQIPKLLWFRLMKLNNLISRPFFEEDARRYDITMNEVRVMMSLASVAHQAVHEIADSTGLHPMNVSRAVARLRRKGRVLEARDPANGRRKLVTLSTEGTQLYEQLLPKLDRQSDEMFGMISSADGATMERLVNQLIAGLEAAQNARPAPPIEWQ